MKIATISSKGQITIPQVLLKQLALKPKGKVLVQREKDNIVLKPIKRSVADRLAGALTQYVHPSKLGVSFDVIMEETKKIVAKELAEKSLK